MIIREMIIGVLGLRPVPLSCCTWTFLHHLTERSTPGSGQPRGLPGPWERGGPRKGDKGAGPGAEAVAAGRQLPGVTCAAIA